MNPKDQIKETLSILDVVSTYIKTEKSGAQYRARCPFHSERTPSFYVSPERKSFHCFGCQVHGDIFTFVEKIENIPFYEALKILADRAGVTLTSREQNKEESRLVSLLAEATVHFENNLASSVEAKSYLLDRGIHNDTIQTFHIGYAKNEWRDLFIHLASKGYSPEEMMQAGLVIEAKDESGKTKGFYDRFRGRVMFPIRNISGATVGYSGRILPSLATDTQGKYVNTPETALYHKSKILFGYDTARKRMAESKQVVVVEGQMDLCMSYQAGVHNTVAVSGTAFTDEHINLIKRFCDSVVLSFDSDGAGQNALRKTALLCLLGGLDTYVVGAIGTKDPADLIKENPSAWVDALSEKRHVIEHLTMRVIETEGDERKQGQRIVTEVLPFIRAVQSPIDRVHFIRMVAEIAGIDESAITEELSRGPAIIQTQEDGESKKPTLPPKERVTRELIALIILGSFEEHEEVKKLHLDMTQFPEAIIQEELFALEEKVIGDKEKYLHDLIRAFRREKHREELMVLQSAIKKDGADVEGLLRQIQEHMKKGY
jgi:DNA primase